ncbi:MAG TPA: c-type cytochrome [Gemmatimonadales bacterium]|nr:c-type cytochrome [Gemmatimonadales bacterium]
MPRPSTVRPLLMLLLACPAAASAQAQGVWPPDSLTNTQVIPRDTPVSQVIGIMRNFAFDLGVRCQFCHVGREGQPLSEFDFASDDKPTKRTARQMMRMVEEVRRRLDTLPVHAMPHVEVTCRTCHRGVERPVPLSTILIGAATAGGPDSGVRMYQALRDRYYGRVAYDFGESSLNIAAFRLARDNRFEAALAYLDLNERLYPGSSGMYVFRGNVLLMRGDTTAAAAAYREAVRRDTANGEAKGRLRDIGQGP